MTGEPSAPGQPSPPSGQTPYGPPPYGETPYGPPPYGQTPYAQRPESQRPLAIVALVLSFLMCGIVSLALAVVAFVNADKAPDTGRRIAVIAMVTSLLMPLLYAGGVLAFGVDFEELLEPERDPSGQVTSSGLVDKNDLRVGDCVVDGQLAALDEGESTETASARVEVVPCERAHDMEVLAVFAQRPGDSVTSKNTLNTCLREVAAAFRGHRRALRDVGLSFYANATATGQVVCLGYRGSGGQLTAPLK